MKLWVKKSSVESISIVNMSNLKYKLDMDLQMNSPYIIDILGSILLITHIIQERLLFHLKFFLLKNDFSGKVLQ